MYIEIRVFKQFVLEAAARTYAAGARPGKLFGFGRFSGRDKIVLDGEGDAEKRERYWHDYRGGLLIEM